MHPSNMTIEELLRLEPDSDLCKAFKSVVELIPWRSIDDMNIEIHASEKVYELVSEIEELNGEIELLRDEKFLLVECLKYRKIDLPDGVEIDDL